MEPAEGLGAQLRDAWERGTAEDVAQLLPDLLELANDGQQLHDIDAEQALATAHAYAHQTRGHGPIGTDPLISRTELTAAFVTAIAAIAAGIDRARIYDLPAVLCMARTEGRYIRILHPHDQDHFHTGHWGTRHRIPGGDHALDCRRARDWSQPIVDELTNGHLELIPLVAAFIPHSMTAHEMDTHLAPFKAAIGDIEDLTTASHVAAGMIRTADLYVQDHSYGRLTLTSDPEPIRTALTAYSAF